MASVNKRTWTGPKGDKLSKYVVRYFSGGKHRQETFTLKRDADAFKRKVENDLEGDKHIANADKLTVAAVCDLFLNHQEDRKRDGRIGGHHFRTMRFAVDRSIVPHIGHILLPDLTMSHVEDLYTGMCKADGLSVTTAKMRIDTLMQIELFALKRNLTKKTPVKEAREDLKGIPKKRIRTFTPDEISRLLHSVEQRPPSGHRSTFLFRQIVVGVAVYCGLRYGEIMGITLKNVNLGDGIIQVRHSYSDHDGLKAPKTKSGIRDVHMPAALATLVKAWVDKFYVHNDQGLLFLLPGSTRPPSGPNWHANHWYPILRRAGFEGDDDRLHFHALRHFAASSMIEVGLPITDVASMLGHAKFDMTLQVYAHPIVGGSRRRDAIENMARRMVKIAPPISYAPVAHGAVTD